MMKSMKRLMALALALLLCLSFAGCYSQDKTWAAKMGNDTMPIGAYIYYLSSAYPPRSGSRTGPWPTSTPTTT